MKITNVRKKHIHLSICYVLMYIHLYRALYNSSSLFYFIFCHGFHRVLASGMKELQAMNNWLLGALQCTAWLIERLVERDGDRP